MNRIKKILLFRKHRGQSLLELVIALGVIGVGMTALLSLTMITVTGNRQSRFRFLGYNLAREGVELVRGLRENNYVSERVFNSDIGRGYAIIDPFWVDPFCPSGVIDCADPNNIWMKPRSVSPSCFSGAVWSELCRLYQSRASTVYGYEPGLGTATPFYRQLVISEICKTDGTIPGPTGNCGAKGVKGMQVTSDVRWKEGGRNYQATLTEQLYDWRLSQ